MPWFKIDDGFWSHPKVLELTDEAIALWVRAGSYCAGHLTDGVVKRSTLRILAADHNAATELVLAGLWDFGEGTWSFHDWEDYQPTREEVLAERAAATERKRRSREKSRAESRRDTTVTDGGSHSPPTRPDPTRPPTPDGVGGTRVRASRIPEPFLVTRRMREWAAENVPDVDVDASTLTFVDYWRSESGAKASKRDWEATWRNWLRRDHKPTARTRPSKDQQAMDVLAMGARLHQQQEIEP